MVRDSEAEISIGKPADHSARSIPCCKGLRINLRGGRFETEGFIYKSISSVNSLKGPGRIPTWCAFLIQIEKVIGVKPLLLEKK